MSGFTQPEVIDSMSGDLKIASECINTLLRQQPEKMVHNGRFSGKPETRIYASPNWVAKLNINRSYADETIARRWCELQVRQEREFAVYHPDRTWFIVRLRDVWLCANVTPRMQPLNLVDFSCLNERERIGLFVSIVATYFDFVNRSGKRLDGGFSNFVYCDVGQLCYLDDDIYMWDNCSSFVAMLANWLRRSSRLAMNEDAWRAVGQEIRPLLLNHSTDTIDIVCEMLVDQVVGKSEDNKSALLQALRPAQTTQMGRDISDGIFSAKEPLGLIADVHANLPAFEAVLERFAREGVKRILMLGDIVGYGPHPKECIDLARSAGLVCIRGNHDHYVAHEGNVRVAASSSARWTLEWTLEQLEESDKQWLGALPVKLASQQWLAVHGAPIDKSFFNGYVYNMTAERNLNFMMRNQIGICLHGHSHIQGVYAMQNKVGLPMLRDREIDLRPLQAALVCPGSTGQPRQGFSGAEGAILYPESLHVQMFAVDYDVEAVARDMQHAGFPEKLVERQLEFKRTGELAD